jgi:RimJ/RimL family protein N-acetyltransferase
VTTLRLLVPGDEAGLFELLSPYADTSMFFFSNVERAGLVDRGEPFQGTYVASFDESGTMTAVAAHSWNGNVMVQGDQGLEDAAVRAVSLSGRAVRGFVGAWALVSRARAALGLQHTPAAHDGRELLFSLALGELVLPSLLSRPHVVLRPPTPAEVDARLAGWRAEYQVECLGAARTPELTESALQQMRLWHDTGALWVLLVDGAISAMTGFNAEGRGIVQVGGVFTPPELRGRGYARAAVAASLQLARNRGLTRSVLFTSESNHAAQRAYTSLGYAVTGDYGLVLF